MGTLGEIEAEVAQILDRDDLTASVSRWVARAHLSVQLRHTWEATESRYDVTPLVDGAWSVPLPSDIRLPTWIGYVSATTGLPGREIYTTSFETVRYLRKDNVFRRGLYGAFFGGLLELSEPVSTQFGQLIHFDYIRFAPVPTNPAERDWFTIYAHNVIVYRALEESAPFLGDDSRLAMWRERSADAFKEIFGAEVQAKLAGEMVMRG